MTNQTRRIDLALGLLAVCLIVATTVPAEVARVPLMLEVGRAAGRHRAAGPLFLAGAGVSTPRLDSACTAYDAGSDLPEMYLSALACRAENRGDRAVTTLRALVAARFRPPFSSAMLAFELQSRGLTPEASDVWHRCPAALCEALLARAGTIETCSAAAALSGGGRRASFCLGQLFRRTAEFDGAMTWFERALEAPGDSGANGVPSAVADPIPTVADILYRMGEIELARGRLAEARRFTSECLAAEPEHYWGRFQWALLLSRAGDTKSAIEELEHLIAGYPAHGAAMLNLGLLYESIGNNKTAEYWFLEARKVLPDKRLADAELRQLGAAQRPTDIR